MEDYKTNYLHANDLTEESIIEKAPISRQRYVQIYRLTEKPTSIASFDGYLYQTVDLAIRDNEEFSYSFAFSDDQIIPNRNYYYLFRSSNQLGNFSKTSLVYEAKLVNDGGYDFVIFNVLEESDLQQDAFTKQTKDLKKLLQLQPSLRHINIDTSNVDFSQPANTQIDNVQIGSADDLIWDKTFKIRLTSKKTGRKIDLNITYKLNS